MAGITLLSGAPRRAPRVALIVRARPFWWPASTTAPPVAARWYRWFNDAYCPPLRARRARRLCVARFPAEGIAPAARRGTPRCPGDVVGATTTTMLPPPATTKAHQLAWDAGNAVEEPSASCAVALTPCPVVLRPRRRCVVARRADRLTPAQHLPRRSGTRDSAVLIPL